MRTSLLSKVPLRQQFLCTPDWHSRKMGIYSRLELFVLGAKKERKTAIFDAVSRPESEGNILTLPNTLTGLKRDIFLGAENRTGEIIACPVLEYSTVCHNCFGQRVVNKFISDYPKRPVFTALNLKCFPL